MPQKCYFDKHENMAHFSVTLPLMFQCTAQQKSLEVKTHPSHLCHTFSLGLTMLHWQFIPLID